MKLKKNIKKNLIKLLLKQDKAGDLDDSNRFYI